MQKIRGGLNKICASFLDDNDYGLVRMFGTFWCRIFALKILVSSKCYLPHYLVLKKGFARRVDVHVDARVRRNITGASKNERETDRVDLEVQPTFSGGQAQTSSRYTGTRPPGSIRNNLRIKKWTPTMKGSQSTKCGSSMPC